MLGVLCVIHCTCCIICLFISVAPPPPRRAPSTALSMRSKSMTSELEDLGKPSHVIQTQMPHLVSQDDPSHRLHSRIFLVVCLTAK